jgi:hypothetical protein
MITDDIMPATAYLYPPASVDEASARISNFSSAGQGTFYGLIGLVFESVDQFRMAMVELGWNIRAEIVMDSGRVKTWKATALGQDGTEYRFLLNEAPRRMDVLNCKLMKIGDMADKAALKAVEDTLGI